MCTPTFFTLAGITYKQALFHAVFILTMSYENRISEDKYRLIENCFSVYPSKGMWPQTTLFAVIGIAIGLNCPVMFACNSSVEKNADCFAEL